MIITGNDEVSDKDQRNKSYSETSELNRTFISMRNNLRESLSDLHEGCFSY